VGELNSLHVLSVEKNRTELEFGPVLFLCFHTFFTTLRLFVCLSELSASTVELLKNRLALACSSRDPRCNALVPEALSPKFHWATFGYWQSNAIICLSHGDA
jgi:hypothetical protein